MTPEEREILRRVAALAEENNALLKKTIRRGRVAAAFRFLYWLVVIGLSVSAYYYVQPYIEKMIPVLNTAISEVNAEKNL